MATPRSLGDDELLALLLRQLEPNAESLDRTDGERAKLREFDGLDTDGLLGTLPVETLNLRVVGSQRPPIRR